MTDEPARPELTAGGGEAIVDSLGFCGVHGSLLAQQTSPADAVGRALGDATGRMIAWLSDERRNADRLLELFFGADRRCLACKLHERQVARQVRQLRLPDPGSEQYQSLCFPHYRAAVYSMKSPTLPGLVDAQLRLLERVVSITGPATGDSLEETAEVPMASEVVGWALQVVAGSAAIANAGVHGPDLGDPCIDPLAGAHASGTGSADPGCPACAEIRAAELRWTRAVTTAAKLGRDLWTVFPTCPTHIARCATSGNGHLASVAARYAAAVELAALQRGARALARDNGDRQAARESVFFRRKSPAWILGRQRRMITDVPRCPACERVIVAQERAVLGLVNSLSDPHTRVERKPFDRLCLKHLGSIYVLAPSGKLRSWLIDLQLDRLTRLRERMASPGQPSNCATAGDLAFEATAVWQTAMPPLERTSCGNRMRRSNAAPDST